MIIFENWSHLVNNDSLLINCYSNKYHFEKMVWSKKSDWVLFFQTDKAIFTCIICVLWFSFETIFSTLCVFFNALFSNSLLCAFLCFPLLTLDSFKLLNLCLCSFLYSHSGFHYFCLCLPFFYYHKTTIKK